jgi:hypothetical protein
MLREDIILKIEELENQTKTYKKLLQVWDKSGLEQRTGTAMRFYQARPSSAVDGSKGEGTADPRESYEGIEGWWNISRQETRYAQQSNCD